MTGEHDIPCVELARTQEHVANLTKWQQSQNGHLQRIDERIETVKSEMMGKLDRINWWIIGLLTSTLLAVALLAVNLASKKI